MNKAGYVRGVQIGLINLSEKIDGITIGLVNISKTGSVHGIVWSGGARNLNAGIKFSPNEYWYTILSAGRGDEFEGENDTTSIGYYMGIHIPIIPRLYVELDLGNNSVFNGDMFDDRDWKEKVNYALETRVSIGFKLYKRLSVFAGMVNTRTGKDIDQFKGGETENSAFFGIQF